MTETENRSDMRIRTTSREVEQIIDEKLSFLEADKGRLRRTAIAGNAGGAVATLALIGALLGVTNGRGPIPTMVFVCLLCFVIGAVAAVFDQYLAVKSGVYSVMKAVVETVGKDSKTRPVWDPPIWTRAWLTRLSLGLLLTGTVAGVLYLFSFTELWTVLVKLAPAS